MQETERIRSYRDSVGYEATSLIVANAADTGGVTKLVVRQIAARAKLLRMMAVFTSINVMMVIITIGRGFQSTIATKIPFKAIFGRNHQKPIFA